MNKETLKKRVLLYILSQHIETVKSATDSYEQLCGYAYTHIVSTILKTPKRLFFEAIIATFRNDEINVNLIKEVVTDVLEVSGFETSFRNEDWKNLEQISVVYPDTMENRGYNTYDNEHGNLKTTIELKGYMFEFFEDF